MGSNLPHGYPGSGPSDLVEPFEKLEISKSRAHRARKVSEAFQDLNMPDVPGEFERIASEGSKFARLREVSESMRSASDSLASQMSLDDSILGDGSKKEDDVEEAGKQLLRLSKEADVLKSCEDWVRQQKALLGEAMKGEGVREKGLGGFMDKTLKLVSRMEVDILKVRYENSVKMARCTAQLSKTQGHVLKTGYLAAIADKFAPITGAQFETKPSGGRKKDDQERWKERLQKAYGDPEDDQKCWDPVLGRWQQSELLTAAHIVPYALGEDHAAYMFGVHPTRGYDIIWGLDNGLLLHPSIEKAMDQGRLVIVPDPTDPGSWQKELRVVVLDDSVRTKFIDMFDEKLGTYGNLHGKKLVWPDHIVTRPKRRFLYFSFLMTLFRRRRYNVAGWEKDRNQFPPIMWATPDQWVSKSLLRELAKEIGDFHEDDEFLKNNLASFSGPKVSSEVALHIRAGLEAPGYVEDVKDME